MNEEFKKIDLTEAGKGVIKVKKKGFKFPARK